MEPPHQGNAKEDNPKNKLSNEDEWVHILEIQLLLENIVNFLKLGHGGSEIREVLLK